MQSRAAAQSTSLKSSPLECHQGDGGEPAEQLDGVESEPQAKA